MTQHFDIDNQPTAQELWQGIGGHFDSLGQIINEFLDNSVSDLLANNIPNRSIAVRLRELSSKGDVQIEIEDAGTGIKNLDAAFTLGDQSAGETPLNEHGFGLKHALASANPSNDSWSICTRTKDDVQKGVFKMVSAPYEISQFAGTIEKGENWPGAWSGTGTIVRFTCKRDLFLTLGQGIQGGAKAFQTLADILFEDIGFTYAGVISNEAVCITLTTQEHGKPAEWHTVGAVEPYWSGFLAPGKGMERIDLGGAAVDVVYAFGTMNVKPDRKPFDNTTARKYYRRNMSSSGVEIRVNGRVICHNLFKEIWGKEKHNSYNYLLVTLDLRSKNNSALPKTRTSKNGFREGDPLLSSLFKWILKNLSEPKKDSSLSDHEIDLFKQLEKLWQVHNPDPNKVIKTEMPVFTSTGNTKDKVRIDLYAKTMGEVTIYEGKKDSTTSKDVYQLRMYWDGLVYDGVTPDKGVLVADSHPDSVAELIQVVNSMRDQNGVFYNLSLTTWENLGLSR